MPESQDPARLEVPKHVLVNPGLSRRVALNRGGITRDWKYMSEFKRRAENFCGGQRPNYFVALKK
ncbi:MAG: hypothetical protein M1530_03655 [Candidatus Marsarchaeota archaeon]|nr:hypothetical protein [Candidatus Marsarchaeota archaeon]